MGWVTRRDALLCIGAAPLLSNCATVAGADGEAFVQVDGRAIAVRRRRGSSLPIVFESGLGDGLESWDALFAVMAPSLSLFAYSRPGYGASAPLTSDAPRNSEDAARLLARVLDAARVTGPCVLVGHSLGGLYISQFAASFPRRVAGLVYVDGRPAGFRARCRDLGLERCASGMRQQPNWPAAVTAEWRGVQTSEDNAPRAAALSAFPATIIAATGTFSGESAAEAGAVWLAEQEAFASGFTDHRFVRVEAGHYVHQEQPELVAHEIAARVGA